MKLRFWPLISVFLFSSCGGGLDFQNDPRILRGAWLMKLTRISDQKTFNVPLDFTATYKIEYWYETASPAVIDNVAYTLSGEFYGGYAYTFARPQVAPPPEYRATFKDSSGASAMRLIARVISDPKVYASSSADRFVIEGEIFRETPSGEPYQREGLYAFSLERQ
jgi:hypothetical protein